MLREYQQIAVAHGTNFLSTAEPGSKQLYAAPTGTGKSYIERAVQANFPNAWIVTPKIEIIQGMLQKEGIPTDTLSEAATLDLATVRRIITPIRLRNGLLGGSLNAPAPSQLILDESHHDLASSWQDIHALCGYCPVIGYTATPYRGTPQGTAALREQWGEPVWVITYQEAMQAGYLAFPSCVIWPLVDDDTIEVVNGELVATQVNDATLSRLDSIVERSLAYCNNGTWDMPTMFSLPSTETARALATRLQASGGSAVIVTGETPLNQRGAAFRTCLDRSAALVQIAVVSEGVDLPIRRLIDVAPSLSPVRWVQQFGRITRPTDATPEYICTNRNLLRHGYLLDGCLPSGVIKQAQLAFPPSKRAAARAIGLEAIGRLKGVQLPFRDGITGICYSFSAVDGHTKTDYFVIVHPAKSEPLWAIKHSTKVGDNYQYGSWEPCEPPTDVTGYASNSPSMLSDKQREWWKRSAKRFGLDPEQEVTRKSFQALPVLSDLQKRGIRCKF